MPTREEYRTTPDVPTATATATSTTTADRGNIFNYGAPICWSPTCCFGSGVDPSCQWNRQSPISNLQSAIFNLHSPIAINAIFVLRSSSHVCLSGHARGRRCPPVGRPHGRRALIVHPMLDSTQRQFMGKGSVTDSTGRFCAHCYGSPRPGAFEFRGSRDARVGDSSCQSHWKCLVLLLLLSSSTASEPSDNA